MADKSAIEWTDATWNPVKGTQGRWMCTKVSDGCQFCYAERMNLRFGGPEYKVGADQARLDQDVLLQPLHWKRPRRIFVCSMTDLFQDAVSDWDILQVWLTMAMCREHTFQVLTKRPKRMHDWIHGAQHLGPDESHRLFAEGFWPLPNVWLGVSAEDQQRLDERVPWLLATPATVRFVSAEPLLGPLDLGSYFHASPTNDADDHAALRPIRWLIAGGESGGPAERRLVERCMHGLCQPGYVDKSCPGCDGTGWIPLLDQAFWVRSIRDQCQAAGVAFLFKQFGGPTPKSGGRLLDGREWNEFPQVVGTAK